METLFDSHALGGRAEEARPPNEAFATPEEHASLTYTRRVRIFLPVAILSLALAAPIALLGEGRVPTPDSVFGFRPGADYKLATYDQSVEYFKKLAASTKHMKMVEAGKTSQGRTMYFALISTPDNLSKIDRYREIARRLAHPQGLTDAEARKLAREGKAFVHIDGGLHATEVAGPQHTPLLAYDLVSRANDPDVKAMLEHVIVMVWPTINPDGQQMVAEWYMQNVGTPYELSGLPRLYQEYVGHDNNRDAYMLNMIESRVLEHAWRQWEPQIIYVHHQSGPFPTRIWLPPFSEPVGTDAPFIMSREVNMIGMAIAKGLEERGQVGATHMGTAFDAWYPGYVDYAPNFKNIAAFWTETALFQYATPHDYTIDDFPQNMRDLRPQSLYSSPWPPGRWRLRDAVDYMETASLSVIEFAAKYKDSLLFNRYQAGRDQIALGRKKAPYAYFVPQQQRDPVAAVELLRRIAFGGVRVSELTAPVTVGADTFPAGTWVIPTDQEFAAMAREVLDVQTYPGSAPVSRRPARAAVRRRRLVAAAADGRPRRRRRVAAHRRCAREDEAHRRAARAESEADHIRGSAEHGRGAVRQPAGRRLQHRSRVGSDRAAAGPHHRIGPGARRRSGAEQRVQRDQPRVAAGCDRPGERRSVGRADSVHDPRARRERAGGPRRIARAAGGADALGAGPRRAAAAHRPVPAVDRQHGRRLDALGARAVRLRVRHDPPGGFQVAALRERSTSSSSPTMRACRSHRGAGAGQAAAAAGVAARCVRGSSYQLTASDLQAFERFVRGGGTLVCLSNASTFAIQQLKLPVGTSSRACGRRSSSCAGRSSRSRPIRRTR